MSKQACIGKGTYTTVDALLDAFHQGAAEASLQLYFGCFHREGRFLGTDATENWHVNDFFDWSLPHFKAGHGWVFRPISGSRKLTYYPDERNPLFCVFDELVESEQFVATSRGSGTLVFSSDTQTWLVAQYHLSFPIPNDLATYITKKIAIFEASTKEASAAVAAAEAARRLIEEWDLEDKKPSSAQGKKKGGKSKK
ncbi:hypothetical protein H310_04076 [Aphanomyces invadans]|uniref:SnoaL-like domain-containing protein n=1 Tax=Aphanomyces invadans TaxID=157072 RepID=A0A024UGN0_9STRA|nr:hypothetical protein H310_04076 [Aphanomyces invadans]ETW05027.1 hypothetical protein H310_04076 [Aphanomyces invadans]RHY29967.1 hypothetical protein DYB32_004720 [Aphanomyces invadans]|eukprot:XP_008866465.1 hypothetical protein H310_04076 [Aphanomyces invadans]